MGPNIRRFQFLMWSCLLRWRLLDSIKRREILVVSEGKWWYNIIIRTKEEKLPIIQSSRNIRKKNKLVLTSLERESGYWIVIDSKNKKFTNLVAKCDENSRDLPTLFAWERMGLCPARRRIRGRKGVKRWCGN